MTETSDSFKRFLAYSGGLHVLIAALLIMRSFIAPTEPKQYIPSLRVDLVALPDLKKNDLVQPTKEPEKEIPQEKPKAEPEKKLDVKTSDDGEISLKKKKDLSRKEKEAQTRLKNALARIKALERIKMMAGQPVKGNAVSKGSSLSGDAKTSLTTTYYDVVLERVRNNWELPKWLQDQSNLSAQVQIYIDRHGKVIRYEFKRTSGNEAFDNEVKRSIQSSAPFSPPPSEISGDVSSQGIILGFPI